MIFFRKKIFSYNAVRAVRIYVTAILCDCQFSDEHCFFHIMRHHPKQRQEKPATSGNTLGSVLGRRYSNDPHDVGPDLQKAVAVIFNCQRIAEKYQKRIEEFLDQLLVDGDDFSCWCPNKENKHEEQDDRAAMMNGSGTPKVPLYDSHFDDTLEYAEKSDGDAMGEPESQKMTCFNCLGDHHLNECPQDHDASRIASNKRSIMENSQNTIRYHTDDSQPLEKNSSVCPGRISDALRNALNLKPNQLPLYIYHMRVLGYPPGWMKEAEIEHSGLSVYDSNGNAVGEDGEKETVGKKFNGENFISYPGFNAPFPDGFIDEWKPLRMLPMQPHQQLSEALKHSCVTKSPNYKKRKSMQIPDPTEDVKRSKTDDKDDDENKELDSTPVKASCVDASEEKEKKQENAAVASVIPGSPLIDTGNRYKRLPDCSKFSADITEHLPYENLPDAVGAYDKKMRGVLDQVRQDMSRLQEN